MYVYAANNPIKYTDPDGREAGDLFDTMDEAAKDFAKTYNDDSIKLNRELGSSIYINKDGKYYYTIPSKGFKASVKPSTIMGEKRVAMIHTHTDGFQMDRFSDTDLIIASKEGIISYLVLSDGILVKFDPSKPYDIEKNPSEIYPYDIFPNLRNYTDFPNNKVLGNIVTKGLYFFNKGK